MKPRKIEISAGLSSANVHQIESKAA